MRKLRGVLMMALIRYYQIAKTAVALVPKAHDVVVR